MPLPRRLTGRHDLLVSLLLLAVSALGCDSPTAPGDSNVLTFGRVTSGHVAAGETKSVVLDVKAGQSFAVYVQAAGGAVALTLQNSAAQVIGRDIASPGDTATMYYGVEMLSRADERYTILVSAASPSNGGDFTLRPTLIDVAPEHAPRVIAFGEVVSGERIDHRFDNDEFLIDVPVARTAELYVGADVGSALVFSVVRVGDAAIVRNGVIWPPTGWDDLELGASGRFALEPGRYAVLFAGTAGSAYRFQLQTVNPKPETASELLTLGDTVAESIDYVGDQDDFVLRGTPGNDYEVFVSAGGAAPHAVQVLLPELTQLAGHWPSAAPGGALLDAATGRFTMPAAGQITVRVQDVWDKDGLYRGPYRLVAVPIDRRPEGLSDVIVPSANVIASALEIYGDVDEYRFTLDTPKRLALRCAPTPTGGCSVYRAAVYRDDAPTQPLILDSGVPLPAGAYRLRVESGSGLGRSPMYRGPYQLVLAPVDTTPEDVPPTLTIGTTVSETATWPWDIDTFTLDVASADTVLVHLAVADSTGSRYRVSVTDVVTGRALGVLDEYESPTDHRIDLAPGRYAVTVNAFADGWTPGRRGSYQLGVQRVTAAPEGRGAAVAFGDTVRSTLDYKGDIDDYVLTGAPWEMVSVALIPEALDAQGQQFFAVASIDPVTGMTFGSTWTAFSPSTAVPVEIPAGGTLRLRACSLLGCPGEGRRNPYTFAMSHVNGAPESRPATFVVGDTVAESLANALDVDEFAFDGTAGQAVDLIGLLAPTTPYGSTGALMEVLDQTTNDRIALLPIRAADVQTMTAVLRGLVLPHTGRYLVRIRPEPTVALLYPTGPYRFVIAPH